MFKSVLAWICCSDETNDTAAAVGATVSCCAANRKKADENPLCGQCEDDFYEWGGDCVCESPLAFSFVLGASDDVASRCRLVVRGYGGFVFLFILVSWLWVLIFHMISQRTRGETKVCLLNPVCHCL